MVCLSPAILLLVSLVYGVLTGHDRASAAGHTAAVVGLLVAFVNGLYLSLGRRFLYRWWHGGMEGYKHVSILPGIGTMLAALAAVLNFGGKYAALSGLIILVIDTGGLPWFLVATWRDRGFWDGDTNWKPQ